MSLSLSLYIYIYIYICIACITHICRTRTYLCKGGWSTPSSGWSRLRGRRRESCNYVFVVYVLCMVCLCISCVLYFLYPSLLWLSLCYMFVCLFMYWSCCLCSLSVLSKKWKSSPGTQPVDVRRGSRRACGFVIAIRNPSDISKRGFRTYGVLYFHMLFFLSMSGWEVHGQVEPCALLHIRPFPNSPPANLYLCRIPIGNQSSKQILFLY